jgi:hypothetical protein
MRLRASTNQIVMPEICRRKPWRDPAAEATLRGQPHRPIRPASRGWVRLVSLALPPRSPTRSITRPQSACRNLLITPDKLAR